MGMVRSLRLGLAAVTASAAMLIAAPSAHAAEYRYWGYWTTGTAAAPEGWAFSPVGPAFRGAEDGSVEGWRLAIAPTMASAIDAPRVPAASAFDDVCASTAPVAGRIRVGVVVDMGRASDAPDGEQPPSSIGTCVVLQEGASGLDVLRAAIDVRMERGMVCGIAGYPSSGCAEAIGEQPPPEPERPEPAASPEQPETSAPADTQPSRTADASPTVPGDGRQSAASSPSPASALATGEPTASDDAISSAPIPEPTETVELASPADTVTQAGSGSPLPLLVALAAIAIVLGVAVVLRRRS